MEGKKVLLTGESWQTLELHIKGFDMFYRGEYEEGADDLRTALSGAGIEVDYMPCHMAPNEFPESSNTIGQYDTVILSDVGYNTLAVPTKSFTEFKRTPNRLDLLDAYVEAGGSLLMIGGYMSFQGIKGEGGYHKSTVEDILPVTMEPFDDRVECSEGVVPEVIDSDHAITEDLSEEWPYFLGYNQVTPDEDSKALVEVNADPLLVVGDHGDGRVAAFTSDCAPHWGPPAFTEWEQYSDLWTNIITWLVDGDA
jgi:uncharacterized membrane protein